MKTMERLPGALFIVDPHKEDLAVKEAQKVGIPIVAMVDTNCDPDPINYIIPCNDDAIRSIRLIASKVADAAVEGQNRRESSQADQMRGGRYDQPAPEPDAQPEFEPGTEPEPEVTPAE
jgi:small subunit ribosomal protein S2